MIFSGLNLDSLAKINHKKIGVPMLCILNVGTVPMLCVLNVGTVPTLCILNVGTVPTFSHSQIYNQISPLTQLGTAQHTKVFTVTFKEDGWSRWLAVAGLGGGWAGWW